MFCDFLHCFNLSTKRIVPKKKEKNQKRKIISKILKLTPLSLEMFFYYHGELALFPSTSESHRPYRARITRALCASLGLSLTSPACSLASRTDLGQLHSDSYLTMLQVVSDESTQNSESSKTLLRERLKRFDLHLDGEAGENRVFPGIYTYARMCATGSLAGASRLNSGSCDLAVNLFGGQGRAKRSRAAGGCFVNDSVLACLQLLGKHSRVLHVSLDVEHCDGVEEAFYTTDRVMTMSFHDKATLQTGLEEDGGYGVGKGYAVNIPIDAQNATDELFVPLFTNVLAKTLAAYEPTVIVFIASPSVVSHDRMGDFSLTLEGYAQCVDAVLKAKLPTLILGGSGSNVAVASMAWAVLVGKCLGKDLLGAQIPKTFDMYEYFAPDYCLKVSPMDANPLFPANPQRMQDLEHRVVQKLDILQKERLAASPILSIIEPAASPTSSLMGAGGDVIMSCGLDEISTSGMVPDRPQSTFSVSSSVANGMSGGAGGSGRDSVTPVSGMS